MIGDRTEELVVEKDNLLSEIAGTKVTFSSKLTERVFFISEKLGDGSNS